jgi:hypothetical protein
MPQWPFWNGNTILKRQPSADRVAQVIECLPTSEALSSNSDQKKPGTVAHNCNPSYLRDKDREDHHLRPTWATSQQIKTSVMVHICNPTYMGEA